MSGYIDIVCNPFTPYVAQNGLMGVDEDFMVQIRMPEDMRAGVEIEDYLQKMDRAEIERSLLIAHRCGDLGVKGSFEITYDYVRDICSKYPDRFPASRALIRPREWNNCLNSRWPSTSTVSLGRIGIRNSSTYAQTPRKFILCMPNAVSSIYRS